MRPTSSSSTIRLAVTAAALGCALSVLTGCSGFGGASFPAASAVPTTAQIGSVSGNVYGGHAPLVGAHIYLVQPGTAGFGSQVTSIMTNDAYGAQYGSAYALYTNGSFPNTAPLLDQLVPTGFKGVMTTSKGEFAINGDYTCTVGQPVILIAYGGSPSFAGAGPNAFNVTSETVTLGNGINASGVSQSGGLFTYTVNTPSPELFYPGESVAVTGNTGINAGYNQTGPVQASGLTTTSFTIFIAGYTGGGSLVATTGVTATGTPVFNPAAVNMAVLGNCPSNGTFASGPSALGYIYVNEISTVATAYAFVGFTDRGDNSLSGNDEFHIGSANDLPQATLGMANAAITAGLLYDIQGSNIATNNPDGDVHIARSTTPGGNGSVSQTTINNLGNILASCVDSNNTYRVDLSGSNKGVQSPQCQQLGYYAPDNGNTSNSTTHQTVNIAQAAFAIARNPQIDGSSSVAALWNIPAGNIPFTPQLSAAPNDWSVVIGWSPSAANGGTATPVQDVAIDSQGNVWAPTRVAGTNQVFELTPGGVFTGYTALISPQVEQIAIDVNDHPWVPGVAGNYRFTAGTPAGTLVGASALNGGGIAVDASANQYVASTGRTPTASLVKQSPAGALAYNVGLTTNCGIYMDFITLDSAGLVWTATANPTSPATSYICRYSTTGSQMFSYPITGSLFTIPHFIATDMGDNLWFAEKNLGTIYSATKGTTSASGVGALPANTTSASSASGYVGNTNGGGPVGIVIDGSNLTWVGYQNLGASNGLGGLIQYSNGTKGFLAQTPTYLTGGALPTETTRSGLNGLAADPSGNLWAASAGNYIYEYVGLVTPTVTPLAYAKSIGKTGTRP